MVWDTVENCIFIVKAKNEKKKSVKDFAKDIELTEQESKDLVNKFKSITITDYGYLSKTETKNSEGYLEITDFDGTEYWVEPNYLNDDRCLHSSLISVIKIAGEQLDMKKLKSYKRNRYLKENGWMNNAREYKRTFKDNKVIYEFTTEGSCFVKFYTAIAKMYSKDYEFGFCDYTLSGYVYYAKYDEKLEGFKTYDRVDLLLKIIE